MEKIILVEETSYDLLLDAAFATGCRAVDAHCIATAITTNAALVSVDIAMVANAKKHGARADRKCSSR